MWGKITAIIICVSLLLLLAMAIVSQAYADGNYITQTEKPLNYITQVQPINYITQ